jgi:hypothetical protein
MGYCVGNVHFHHTFSVSRREDLSAAGVKCRLRESPAVVDSKRCTRICTIGVDLSTPSWYIRQDERPSKRSLILSAEDREYSTFQRSSIRATDRCGNPMLMKSAIHTGGFG